MKAVFARFIRQEEGQDLVEYAFLVGLIALVAAAGVTTLGGTVNTYYGTTINGATPFSS
jgi:pilus assembly protein Flp/PilA